MKSGDFSISRENDYSAKAFSEIKDRVFVQRTFTTRPALVAKYTVDGHRMWKDYHGGAYDASQFDLVEGMWDHEHCSICYFTISHGFTYWENAKRIKLLCDACHESLIRV